MSRSSERTAGRRAATRIACAVAGVAGLTLTAAFGVSDHAVAAGNGTSQTFPVVPMELPVVPMVFPTQDLNHVAVVTPKPHSVSVTLDSTISFAKDSAVLRPQARARLAQVSAELARYGHGKLLIQGFTDDLGTEEHGLILSRQRASAVGSVLRGYLPVGSYPMVTQGLGESHFLVPNTSEANRRINRRVEITFTPSG